MGSDGPRSVPCPAVKLESGRIYPSNVSATILSARGTASASNGRLKAMARRLPIFLAVLFAILLVDAALRDPGEFDYRLMRLMQRLDFPGVEPVLRFLSALTGSFWAITLWTMLLFGFLVTRRWLAAAGMGAFPLAGGINMLVREAVGRSRPDRGQLNLDWMTAEDVTRLNAQNDWASFPSGHVVGAVLLWGFVFLLAGGIASRVIRLVIRSGAAVVILGSGVARVWLGAHWVSDVAAAYALGGLALLAVVVMYRTLEPGMRGIPLVRAAPVPHDDSRPHAHALTSTILFRGEEVSKVYNPGFVPRFIYWLAFQAPFAYAHNPTALQAALARRNLAGLLTEFWFGRSCVGEALRVEQIDGRWALTGRFTEGEEPVDHERARRFLFDLADRFDAAGLPTWQIDPRQPRSLGNVLERADGTYTIIDLESGLVSPLASPRAWWRAIRRGMVPIYDDVYFDLTRKYVEANAEGIRAEKGDAWLARLRDDLAVAESLAGQWHAAEPRLWSRAVRVVSSGFGVRPLARNIRAKVAEGEGHAEEWIERSIEEWRLEGRIDEAEEEHLRTAFRAPELQAVLPHFGVHLMIGVALRFPFGSIVRASYTASNLLLACARFGLGRIDHRRWRMAMRIHSPLVILVAAMPGIGTFAYVVSGPMRSNRTLVRVIFDSVGEKVPFHLYRRVGLRRIIAGKPHYPSPGDPANLSQANTPAADGADGLGRRLTGASRE